MAERRRTARSGEVAAALGVSPATIQSHARNGRIPHSTTPGGQYRFNLDEVREVLGPPVLEPVEDLPRIFTATGPLVDALSGYRDTPFTETVMRRLRIHGQRPEAPPRRQPVTRKAGAKQLADMVKRSGNPAPVAVLHRG
jgi:excisionase family DNA binding protein